MKKIDFLSGSPEAASIGRNSPGRPRGVWHWPGTPKHAFQRTGRLKKNILYKTFKYRKESSDELVRAVMYKGRPAPLRCGGALAQQRTGDGAQWH